MSSAGSFEPRSASQAAAIASGESVPHPGRSAAHPGSTSAARPPVYRPSWFADLLGTFRSLLEFVAVALFVMTFVMQPFRIPSESMIPTLHVGDFLLVDKQSFATEGHWSQLLPPTAIRRGDLAVFHFPVDPQLHLIKRIVGVAGDHIRLRSGKPIVNGKPLPEPYAFYSEARPNNFRDNFPSLRETDPNLDPAWWDQMRHLVQGGEITVPPGEYFVLGDNRNDSEDSRYWGFVPRDALVGRPIAVYFSLADNSAPADVSQPLKERVGEAFRARVLR